MTDLDLKRLPDIALKEDEPVFNEPWEAQAFAMAVNLHQNGLFGWNEWADTLSAEIHSGLERSYYEHWLVALEKIVVAKKLTTGQKLIECEAAWHRAAKATPHGEAIVLSAGDTV
ncbi:nitrile hydratase accessory protein [Phycobacter azelaicus]|jgi:nitrile hydratase accessory protein|uniref:nitrile hydratase accessory protein n=1 Tax=Phycobacter azelaicus TaxID=2668075 RepID=UPI0018689AB1|nr:nitrile hydratase accessory protein [Phycobacter azelaicus]